MTADDAKKREFPVLRPAPEGSGAQEDSERRDLIVMHSGAHAFGVFADETDSVTRLTRVTPLPFAPPAVLGVVAVRGRMRTVIDPVPFLPRAEGQTHSPEAEDDGPRLAVVLKGDEQLALAVERVHTVVDVRTDAIRPPGEGADFARGLVRHEDSEVVILDPARLFEAATRGTERRRVR